MVLSSLSTLANSECVAHVNSFIVNWCDENLTDPFAHATTLSGFHSLAVSHNPSPHNGSTHTRHTPSRHVSPPPPSLSPEMLRCSALPSLYVSCVALTSSRSQILSRCVGIRTSLRKLLQSRLPRQRAANDHFIMSQIDATRPVQQQQHAPLHY